MQREKFAHILVIFMLSLIVLSWFSQNEILLQSASFVPIDPAQEVYKNFFAWDSQMRLGIPTKDFVKIFLSGSWALLNKIGLSISDTEKMFIAMNFLLSGLCMYYLVQSLDLKKEYKNKAALIASLLYMFNMYVAVKIIYLMVFIAYWTIPLILTLNIRYLQGNFNPKYAILFALATILAVPVAANPPHYAVLCMVPFLYSLWFLATGFMAKKHISAKSIFCVFVPFILAFIVNFWWLFPFLVNVAYGLGGKEVFNQSIRRFSQESSFANLFGFFGHWALTRDHLGDPYYPVVFYYQAWFMTGVTYFFMACGFLVLAFKRLSREKLFFFWLLLISLFIAKAVHPPLGWLNMFFYKYLPMYRVFMNQWQKLMPAIILCVVVLLGYFFTGVCDIFDSRKLRKRFHYILFVVILMLIAMEGFPLIRGRHIRNKQVQLKSDRTVIPNYWFTASEWLDENSGDGRVLLLPPNRFSAVAGEYTWDYAGIDIAFFLIQKGLVSKDRKAGDSFQGVSASAVSNQLFSDFMNEGRLSKNLLRLLNVKFILHRNDFDLDFRPHMELANSTPAEVAQILHNTPYVKLVKTFGLLDIYEVTCRGVD